MDNTLVQFIGYPEAFDPTHKKEDPAPLFRHHFAVKQELRKALLKYCPLGLGEGYLNNWEITDNKFLTPTSDYTKTVWYTEHDVTDKMVAGDNLLAIALGNGFYNEALKTAWDYEVAPWRDAPKLWLELTLYYADGSVESVTTDEHWLCEKERSPYRYNQLRAGEVEDATYSAEWKYTWYDDSDWRHAVIVKPPTGALRLCTAPPIVEDRRYDAVALFRNRNGDWVFDFGQNLSGYVNLLCDQPTGTRLHITYAEELDADGNRKDNTLAFYYKDSETQYSELICGDEPIHWQPSFTYYGFRYIIIHGMVNAPRMKDATAIFVHQDMKLLSDFRCSDKTLEKLFRLSRISSLSNLFYMPTDCPTREKLGWCNDAAASAEQMIQNMDMSAFYEKWLQDIMDAMRPNGDLPGIVPSSGWGYAWGSGPISTGVLFLVPYRLYQYTGDSTQLKRTYSTMRHHLNFLETKKDTATGLYAHGLTDWAGPFDADDPTPVPLEYTCTALVILFYRIAALAAKLSGDSIGENDMNTLADKTTGNFKKAYLLPDGRCAIQKQTALAMMIALDLYDDLEPLKEQLKKEIAARNGHFYVGMLGMQYLLPACDICGLQEEAYAMLTATGYPSYRHWFDNDATTMFEHFPGTTSLNHHMYSCVIAWFHNTILGIKQTEQLALHKRIVLEPYFLKSLKYANGYYDTVVGPIRVDWQRDKEGNVNVYIDIPEGIEAHIRLTGYTVSNKSVAPLCNGRNELVCVPINEKK